MYSHPASEPEENAKDTLIIVAVAEPTDSCYKRKFAEVKKDPEANPDYCIRNDRLYQYFLDMANLYAIDMTELWKWYVSKLQGI